MKLSELGRERLKKALKLVLQLGIFGYLLFQLYQIGLQNILTSLPTQPLFYVLYFLIYFSLPVAEIFVYRIKWPINVRSAFPVFVQKKVLNTEVVGYSGEVYLYNWAHKNIEATKSEVGHFIKDNNILSSVASTFITLGLLLYFIFQGYISVSDYINANNFEILIAIIAGGAIIGGIVFQFRRYIFKISFSDSLKIFGLHAFRIIAINAIQILQWEIALPQISLAVWFSLAALLIVASRIPFLPSYDALFVTVALQVSGLVDVPQDLLAGVLTANLILKRILNISTYSAVSFLNKSNPKESAEKNSDESNEN